MPGVIRAKPGGYHGIQNVKFAIRENDTYSTDIMSLMYAQGLTLTPQVGETKQYADNRELFKIPSDTGLDGELKTTAPDPEFDKALGFAIEGEHGLMDVDMTTYARGALYFEFTARSGMGVPSKVKVWLLNVEIGKGARSFSTDKESSELGDYTYPFHVYGDTFMNSDGNTPYLDRNGMEHRVRQITSYPGDADYASFENAVPVPKAPTPSA